MYEKFVQAINDKKLVLVKFNSKEKGIIERTCVPFDFGPSRLAKLKIDKYHFKDLDSPTNSHTLSILPAQIINIEILDESFVPNDYVTWSPVKWFLKRDWGECS